VRRLLIKKILRELLIDVDRKTLERMSDEEFIDFMKRNRNYSDWGNKDAVDYAEVRLAYIQA